MARTKVEATKKKVAPRKRQAKSGHLKIEAVEPPSSLSFMGVKEMKGQMSAVVRGVAEEDKWVVVTCHGKPQAMLIPFSEEDLEDFILANHPKFVKRREEARREIDGGDYLTDKELKKLAGD